MMTRLVNGFVFLIIGPSLKSDREDSLIKFLFHLRMLRDFTYKFDKKQWDTKSQWIYLPAFKSVKRLSSSDKNKSFMGSDFTYSDIAGRKLSQDNHTLIKTTDRFYYIESIPEKFRRFYLFKNSLYC